MADVAATLAAWSSTTSNNAPADATAIGSGLDDNLREIQGVVVRGLSHKGSDIASASTTDIGAVEGSYHDITGTTTITGFGTVRAGIEKKLQFDDVLTLTHGANLILKYAQNHLTTAGDVMTFISEGSGVWRETSRCVAGGDFPPGFISPDGGTAAQAGWLHAYGQAVSRTTYSAIFARYSTTYGVGDGASTFNLPDLRGRVVAGQDDMGGSSANRLTGLTNGVNGDTLGGTGGTESNTIGTTHLPASGLSIPGLSIPSLSVSGTIATRDGSGVVGSTDEVIASNGADGSSGTAPISASTGTGTTGGGTTGNMGSGTALNNVQPTLIVNYAIKT